MATYSSPRRAFLKTGAAGVAGTLLTTRTGKSESPNETIVVGIMGTNNRGNALAKGFASQSNCRVGAVCDVDSRALEKTAATVGQSQSEKPLLVEDFRRMLDNQSIDAIVIAAPDHWHAPATVFACNVGKHVYCEKPASHNPAEGEMAIAASQKNDRVVDIGTQRRSAPKIQEAIARMKKGELGEVLYSRGWYNNRRGPIGTGKAVPVPSWLNYQLWQGPAPKEDYRDNIVHYNWHWFWNWGTGEIGNNGVHAVDICRWGLGVDYPTKVASTGTRARYEDDQETPDTQMATFHFPGNKMITWEGISWQPRGREDSMFGISFHGTEGSLVIDGGGYKIYDMHNKLVEEVSGVVSDSAHLSNFLECIRTNQKPNATIEEAHKSTLLCQLGNIAHRTSSVLEIDPANGHIQNNQAAKNLWGRDYNPAFEPKV